MPDKACLVASPPSSHLGCGLVDEPSVDSAVENTKDKMKIILILEDHTVTARGAAGEEAFTRWIEREPGSGARSGVKIFGNGMTSSAFG